MKGFLVGSIALIFLEVMATTSGAPAKVGGVFTALATATNSFFSPEIPAFKTSATTSAAVTTTPATGATTTAAAPAVAPTAAASLAPSYSFV